MNPRGPYRRHPIAMEALSYAIAMMFDVEPFFAIKKAVELTDRLEQYGVAVYPKALIGENPTKDPLTMVGEMIGALEEEMERKPWLPEWAK